MALVVLTIRDRGTDVDVSLVDEPPIAASAQQFTPAQKIAAAALDAIRAALVAHEDDKPRIITLNAIDLED